MPSQLGAQTIWRIGSTFGLTSVALGAFGAHGLQKRFPELPARSIKNWETASSYLLVHGAVLLGLRSESRVLIPKALLPLWNRGGSSADRVAVYIPNLMACQVEERVDSRRP